jgi:uncharacterized membrane protein YgcG
MSLAQDARSIGQDVQSIAALFGDAVDQLGKLVGNEAQLAKAELSQKLMQAVTGAALIAGAAVLFIPVVVILLIAAALWLTRFDLSPAAAHLIVGLVAGGVSTILALIGMKYFKPENLKPRITLEEVERDVAAAKEIVR